MLIGPIFTVGVLTFAQGIAQGEEADVGKLFVGFKEKLGTLMAVAALYIVMIVAVIAVGAIVALPLWGGADLFNTDCHPGDICPHSAGGGGLLVCAGSGFLADMGAASPEQAMQGVGMADMLPFSVYGILASLVILLGALALVIGLFVALPVLMELRG